MAQATEDTAGEAELNQYVQTLMSPKNFGDVKERAKVAVNAIALHVGYTP